MMIDPHAPRRNPFETPWQVAFAILADRRKTRMTKNTLSRRGSMLVESLSENESEQAVRSLVLGDLDDSAD